MVIVALVPGRYNLCEARESLTAPADELSFWSPARRIVAVYAFVFVNVILARQQAMAKANIAGAVTRWCDMIIDSP